ncbi:hypothetical protein KUTeg_022994 [Tegillarca granosa]|uniref:Sulfotransferase domain-containing protein n=1 Tax=Tegillarca granosa TaxID=220873 RepID=A0ABQ9E417_TEGGR|nr:hypothetical protein KUTeg_022994 [Tegillarca granosa]
MFMPDKMVLVLCKNDTRFMYCFRCALLKALGMAKVLYTWDSIVVHNFSVNCQEAEGIDEQDLNHSNSSSVCVFDFSKFWKYFNLDLTLIFLTVKMSFPSGHTVDFIQAGDMHFPTNWSTGGISPDPRVNVHRIKRMKAREDDILICAFPKAGTHWTWEITHMLLNEKAEYAKKGKETAMLEFHIPDEFDDWPSPRVLNTHYELHNIPREMIDKKCKIIYIQRNPKDVAVSLYHFEKSFAGEDYVRSWDDFVHTFLHDVHTYNNYFTCALSWEHALKNNPDLNVLSLYYEDLKEDPIREITKIARFLNVSYTEEFIAEIAEKCSFKAMKAGDKEVRRHELQNWANYFPDENFTPEESIDRMSNTFFRKGDVGDWKNWFTVVQDEMFDAVYEEKMKDSKLKFRFNL